MKFLSFILFIILLTACNPASPNKPEQPEQIENNAEITPLASAPSDLPDLGEAPELNNEVWLNTTEPLRLANLRGKVVLLDMWTFG